MSAVFFVVWALGIIWAWAVFLIERRWRHRAVCKEEFDVKSQGNQEKSNYKVEQVCTRIVDSWHRTDGFLFYLAWMGIGIVVSIPVLLYQGIRSLYNKISHRTFTRVAKR